MEQSDYKNKFNEIVRPLIEKLKNGNEVTTLEFDLINNYIKNAVDKPNIELSMILIKNHALGKNHLFDYDTIKIIIDDIAKSFSNSKIKVIFTSIDEIDNENTIYLDEKLITNFINGNYIEIFNKLFFNIIL
ncbi:MAG: hypothetical protein IKF44_01045, partial [Mycoplasmataceae bacterium]|nr:hypothetical protein [Mycoplasmataceae bacterium]